MAHYLISEASRLVDEESHVLRYWEEELALKIPRNDLGHRYYTEVQLETFRTIKELKQQGYLLKDIRQYLEEMEREAADGQQGTGSEEVVIFQLDEPDKEKKAETPDEPGTADHETEPKEDGDSAESELPLILPPEELSIKPKLTVGQAPAVVGATVPSVSSPQQTRLKEFRELMTDILADAMEAGLDRVTDQISEQISRQVIKEINYLDREREEWEEEHFRQLDTSIRSCQRKGKFRSEAAAAAEPKRRKGKDEGICTLHTDKGGFRKRY